MKGLLEFAGPFRAAAGTEPEQSAPVGLLIPVHVASYITSSSNLEFSLCLESRWKKYEKRDSRRVNLIQRTNVNIDSPSPHNGTTVKSLPKCIFGTRTIQEAVKTSPL